MIKTLVLDVDGTLTDGHIYIGNDGEIMKAFYAHDAVGVRQLVAKNINVVIITGRESNIIKIRSREMNIRTENIYTGVEDKKEALLKIVAEKGLNLNEIAYMGDDLNDLDAMKICGLAACPNNAVKEIKDISGFVSKYDGGFGAVRELSDFLLRGRR